MPATRVNLTDGLDGLAIVPVMIAAASFALIAYLVGRVDFTEYLQINHVPGTGELSVVIGALIGAGLGFLWFNAPPAAIFMGDTGSLALGGPARHHRGGDQARGGAGDHRRHLRAGGDVGDHPGRLLQDDRQAGSSRWPRSHHHFEQLGWTEPQVVIRFWIVSVVLALIGLSTLKLR